MEKEIVEKILNEDVNPILMQHSGFVILAGIEELDIILEFHGGCEGCHLQFSSTLKMIEKILKEKTEIVDLRVLNVNML